MKKLLLIVSGILILASVLIFIRPTITTKQGNDREVKTKFAILSDTHADSENTRKALKQSKDLGARFIMNTGDLTTVGSIRELTAAKNDFASSPLDHYLIPGDHDLYNSAGTANFLSVIGKTYYSTDKDGLHLISLDTADTEVGIDEEQMSWLKADLNQNAGKPIMLFMHLPLFHPTSSRTLWEKAGNNQRVKSQAEEVIKLLKGKGILAAFAGDHHLSSDYTESESGVKMYIVGALTRERNLQTPRFDLVTVYTDNTFSVDEEMID